MVPSESANSFWVHPASLFTWLSTSSPHKDAADDEAEEVSDATAEREGEAEDRELEELYGSTPQGRVDDLDQMADDDNEEDDDSEGSLVDFIVSDDDPIATYAPSEDDLSTCSVFPLCWTCLLMSPLPQVMMRGLHGKPRQERKASSKRSDQAANPSSMTLCCHQVCICTALTLRLLGITLVCCRRGWSGNEERQFRWSGG